MATAVFALLAILQLRALLARHRQVGQPFSLLAHWRQVFANRPFLVRFLAMMVSGGLAVVGQVPVATWVKARWTPGQAVTRGLALMGATFLPLDVTSFGDSAVGPSPGTGTQGFLTL